MIEEIKDVSTSSSYAKLGEILNVHTLEFFGGDHGIPID